MKRAVVPILVAISFFFAIVMPGCGKEPTEEELLKSATKHHAEDEYDEAINDFQMLVERFPKSDKVPEALYGMAAIRLNKKKEFAKAESLFTELTMEYPNDPTAPAAAYQRARIYVEHLHKPDSAIAAYEYFLIRYPNAISASSARMELSELKKPVKPTK
jgi:TolA-binding protein